MKIKLTALFLAASIAMIGAPLTGDLDISGSVRIGANFADFTPLGGGTGDFEVEPTSTGDFNALVEGGEDDGDIRDLNAVNAPVGVDFSLMNFLTFDADPTITFELTRIDDGSFGACVPGAVTCSVNQFNLINTGGSTVANFNVSGNIYDDGVLVNRFRGSFSQSFAGRSIQSILQEVQDRGFIDSAFEANFVPTAIPEPGSMSLFALGTILTAGVSYIRRRK